jgi:hypothetical protein
MASDAENAAAEWARVSGEEPAMREHQLEIQRRAQVARAPSHSAFDKVEAPGDDPPFEDADQQWVLFSTSHVGMAPRSTNPARPGLRLYGCFPDPESARRFAAAVRADDPTCNLQLDRTHKWVLACRDADRLADATHVAKKTEALLLAHVDDLSRARVEFKDTVESMKARGIDPTTPTVTQGDADDRADSLAAPAPPPASPVPDGETEGAGSGGGAPVLTRSCELAQQCVACISFVDDSEDPAEPEFLFRVYGCFGGEAAADRYVRNVASDRVTDYDMDVVSLLKWVHPTVAVDMKKEFRASELNKIMSDHRAQPGRVAAFEREMERREYSDA